MPPFRWVRSGYSHTGANSDQPVDKRRKQLLILLPGRLILHDPQPCHLEPLRQRTDQLKQLIRTQPTRRRRPDTREHLRIQHIKIDMNVDRLLLDPAPLPTTGLLNPDRRPTIDLLSPKPRLTTDLFSPKPQPTTGLLSPKPRLTTGLMSPKARPTTGLFSLKARLTVGFFRDSTLPPIEACRSNSVDQRHGVRHSQMAHPARLNERDLSLIKIPHPGKHDLPRTHRLLRHQPLRPFPGEGPQHHAVKRPRW